MKVYKVKVNGKVYEVEVEAVDEIERKAEPASVKEEVKAKAEEGEKQILAPIAGKILDVVVKQGDSVRKGQTVAIIEAMKLENEIQSAHEGIVKQILIGKGSDVRNKDVLMILE
ncbi:MAG: biotin/lipoyl-binding protein [Erysipelotrichaceae bacterium]|nr:biotin/lipoyl-binding protein [Erysipelotrichaceae bacterium]